MYKKYPPLIVLLLLSQIVCAVDYKYDHKIRAKNQNLDKYLEFVDATIAEFSEAYHEAGSPRILIVMGPKAFIELGGLDVAGQEDLTVESTVQVSLTETGNANIIGPTASASADIDLNANGTGQTQDIITFRTFMPISAEAWIEPVIDGSNWVDVEAAIVGPLLEAEAIVVDRRTALDFHAEEIFSSLRQDRMYAQREALKKVADIIVTLRTGHTSQTIIRVSGDVEETIPTLSAKILSIDDAQLIGSISSRSTLRTAAAYGITNNSIENQAEILSCIIMERMHNYLKRRAKQ